MNYVGEKALVCGLARSGISAAKLLRRLGAMVTLYDAKTEDALEGDLSELREAGCSFALSQDPEALVVGQDLIVISPGIPYAVPFVQKALRLGVPVIGELELGASVTRGDLIAITGTNGKTTTTTLVGEFFRAAGCNTHVVGNIGFPITETALDTGDEDVTVAEVSSYQCESITAFHPKAAAVLNITEDHLARHGTMEVYAAMKRRVFANQTVADVAVLNFDDPYCRRMAEGLLSRIAWFSRRETVECGAFAENGRVMLAWDGVLPVCRTDEIHIPGAHNLENALAAVAIGGAMGLPAEIMREVLRTFAGVEHRIERVRELDGVTYINDSKGTNVDSTIKAIDTMTKPTILILGGSDKKVSFRVLAEKIKTTPLIKCCVLIGDTAGQIRSALDDVRYTHYLKADHDFDRCIEISREQAVPGDCILLSPACASFDMFHDYEDRGRVFKQKVNALR